MEFTKILGNLYGSCKSFRLNMFSETDTGTPKLGTHKMISNNAKNGTILLHNVVVHPKEVEWLTV